jgi:hypothetical protein
MEVRAEQRLLAAKSVSFTGLNGVSDLLQHSKKGSTALKSHNYLPSARLTVTAARGKDKKQIIDISDVIGTNEDIERRIQEQLERPKAMFSEDGPVTQLLPVQFSEADETVAIDGTGGATECLHCSWLGDRRDVARGTVRTTSRDGP